MAKFKSPMEMLMEQILKSVDMSKVMEPILQMHALTAGIFENGQQINRRLARIEAHLGLSEIEPIVQITVIDNDEIQSATQSLVAGAVR